MPDDEQAAAPNGRIAEEDGMTLDQAYSIVVPFGKYRGRTLRDVADDDITYLPWLRDAATSPRLAKAVGVICDANLVEIEQAVERREQQHAHAHRMRRKW